MAYSIGTAFSDEYYEFPMTCRKLIANQMFSMIQDLRESACFYVNKTLGRQAIKRSYQNIYYDLFILSTQIVQLSTQFVMLLAHGLGTTTANLLRMIFLHGNDRFPRP